MKLLVTAAAGVASPIFALWSTSVAFADGPANWAQGSLRGPLSCPRARLRSPWSLSVWPSC